VRVEVESCPGLTAYYSVMAALGAVLRVQRAKGRCWRNALEKGGRAEENEGTARRAAVRARSGPKRAEEPSRAYTAEVSRGDDCCARKVGAAQPACREQEADINSAAAEIGIAAAWKSHCCNHEPRPQKARISKRLAEVSRTAQI